MLVYDVSDEQSFQNFYLWWCEVERVSLASCCCWSLCIIIVFFMLLIYMSVCSSWCQGTAFGQQNWSWRCKNSQYYKGSTGECVGVAMQFRGIVLMLWNCLPSCLVLVKSHSILSAFTLTVPFVQLVHSRTTNPNWSFAHLPSFCIQYEPAVPVIRFNIQQLTCRHCSKFSVAHMFNKNVLQPKFTIGQHTSCFTQARWLVVSWSLRLSPSIPCTYMYLFICLHVPVFFNNFDGKQLIALVLSVQL